MVAIPVTVRDTSSLDPGKLVLIALAVILAIVGLVAGLVALTVRTRRRRAAADADADTVSVPEAAAVLSSSAPHHWWSHARCFGGEGHEGRRPSRPSPPPPGTPLRAVRDALVAGTARASRDDDHFSCAVCHTRLSIDGGGGAEGGQGVNGAAAAPALAAPPVDWRTDDGGPPVEASGGHGLALPPKVAAADAATASPEIAPWLCTLRCGHVFHARCVTRWAAVAGPGASCPVCKLEVVEGGVGGEQKV